MNKNYSAKELFYVVRSFVCGLDCYYQLNKVFNCHCNSKTDVCTFNVFNVIFALNFFYYNVYRF